MQNCRTGTGQDEEYPLQPFTEKPQRLTIGNHILEIKEDGKVIYDGVELKDEGTLDIRYVKNVQQPTTQDIAWKEGKKLLRVLLVLVANM